MGKKRKFEIEQKDESEFNLPAKFLATSHVRAHEKRLIVVLEGAQLETVKVRIAPNGLRLGIPRKILMISLNLRLETLSSSSTVTIT